jgi:hypothetical protein
MFPIMVIAILLQTVPQQPVTAQPEVGWGWANHDLIDFSKIPPDNAQTTMGIEFEIALLKEHGYEINEAGIISALHDEKDSIFEPLVKSAAASLVMSPYLKVNLKTPGTAAALREVFADAILMAREEGFRESTLRDVVSALAVSGDTSWVNDVLAELPKMIEWTNQLSLAYALAGAGHAEGWPYVRAAIASNDSNRIFTAIWGVEKFDGLPNPDGGQPIDVAAELHQLASATPDNLMWPNFGPEHLKTPIRTHIEFKAAQITRQRGH